MIRFASSFLLVLLLAAAPAAAHDAWLEVNTPLVRSGDHVRIDLFLGNHGNAHRDFKVTGKVDLAAGTWTVIDPAGRAIDLRERAVDTGYTAKEGFWTARHVADSPGLYLVAHTSDKVVHYAPTRSVKSAKVFFVVPGSLDRPGMDHPGFDRVLGHALELVPVTNPVTPMGPGQPLRVRLLLHGEPLPNTTISFIPRGTTLAPGFDERYERRTDERGEAELVLDEPETWLVVAHHADPNAAGDGHNATKYAATLTLTVPPICPCCGE